MRRAKCPIRKRVLSLERAPIGRYQAPECIGRCSCLQKCLKILPGVVLRIMVPPSLIPVIWCAKGQFCLQDNPRHCQVRFIGEVETVGTCFGMFLVDTTCSEAPKTSLLAGVLKVKMSAVL
jgi:hypothetical protein